MKKLLLLLLLGWLASCGSSDEGQVAKRSKTVVAVYPVWKHTPRTLAAFSWPDFSHIAIASIYPRADGALKTDEADLFIESLVSLAHENNKKVIVSIGGAGIGSKGFLSLSKDEETHLATGWVCNTCLRCNSMLIMSI